VVNSIHPYLLSYQVYVRSFLIAHEFEFAWQVKIELALSRLWTPLSFNWLTFEDSWQIDVSVFALYFVKI